MTISQDKVVSPTREKILDTATLLVREQGVKGTSLADIAKRAGISKGTLFYHFSAKDDLIYEMTVRHFKQITDNLLTRVAEMRGQDLEQILQEAVFTILTQEDRGKLNLYLLQEAVTDNKALRDKFRETYNEYQLLMQRFLLLILPDIKKDRLQDLSIILVAMIDGLIIQWLLDPESIKISKVAKLLAASILINKD